MQWVAKVFKIDIEDIQRYSVCPVYYDLFKHNTLNAAEYDIRFKYLSDLKKVIYTYLYRLQAGDNVMVSHLTQNFMKLWSNGRYNKDKKSILYEYNINRDEIEIKRRQGIESLVALHNFFKDNRIFPILINQDYEIKLSKGLIITGKIPLLYQDKDGNILLLDFMLGDKFDNNYFIEDKSFLVTSTLLGVKTITNRNINKIGIYNFKKNKVIYTSRTDKEIELFKDYAFNISKCIYNKIIYPCVNYKCLTCMYQKTCTDNYDTM